MKAHASGGADARFDIVLGPGRGTGDAPDIAPDQQSPQEFSVNLDRLSAAVSSEAAQTGTELDEFHPSSFGDWPSDATMLAFSRAAYEWDALEGPSGHQLELVLSESGDVSSPLFVVVSAAGMPPDIRLAGHEFNVHAIGEYEDFYGAAGYLKLMQAIVEHANLLLPGIRRLTGGLS